jgi:hypothetical protein
MSTLQLYFTFRPSRVINAPRLSGFTVGRPKFPLSATPVLHGVVGYSTLGSHVMSALATRHLYCERVYSARHSIQFKTPVGTFVEVSPFCPFSSAAKAVSVYCSGGLGLVVS